jgi:hypothetical protein
LKTKQKIQVLLLMGFLTTEFSLIKTDTPFYILNTVIRCTKYSK